MTGTDPGRRSYGTGQLYTRTNRHGQDVWYGRGRVDGRKINQRLGLKRDQAHRDGLTRVEAERALAKLIATPAATPSAGAAGVTVAQACAAYLAAARRKGRKPATLGNLESEFRTHLDPFFAGKTLAQVTVHDVADLIVALERKGLAPKTVRNVIGSLSAVCNYACAPRRAWRRDNPCVGAELPAAGDRAEVRFLTLNEIDLLVANARPGIYQDLDRVMFRTAAMTGLRLGELIALTWRDLDWLAAKVRVRRNYVRGTFGTPKSRRSTRTVPLALEVAAELERLSKVSRHVRDDDLVFAHPVTGGPLDPSNVSRRMRATCLAAGLDQHHFHDLRHTFATQCAAAGVAMRTLQEWMGHRDLATTQIYADYAPSTMEADVIAAAFARVVPAKAEA